MRKIQKEKIGGGKTRPKNIRVELSFHANKPTPRTLPFPLGKCIQYDPCTTSSQCHTILTVVNFSVYLSVSLGKVQGFDELNLAEFG